jgi:hypothetical protein
MTRLLRLIFAAAAAVAVVGGYAAASQARNGGEHASPRSGELHVTKECSEYTGLADSFCTITSSNVKAITVGSRVVYLQAAGDTSLDSDIVLVVGPGNYALGHVTLDFATGTGEVRIWGGRGQFKLFHARADVSYLGGPNWAWDGKYRFGRHED